MNPDYSESEISRDNQSLDGVEQPSAERLENTQPVVFQEDGPTVLPIQGAITWQDIEYVQHDKSPLWYVGLLLVVLALIVGSIYFQAYVLAVLIVVMAATVMVYTHSPQRSVNYAFSDKGLYINDKLHPLGNFRAFGVAQGEGHNSLFMIPVKRFHPGVTAYFPTEVGEQLVDYIGSYLPMEDVKQDPFDKIARKLRI